VVQFDYQALQVSLKTLSMASRSGSYVWSKTIDDFAGSGNGCPSPSCTGDPNTRKLDRGSSSIPSRRSSMFIYVYQLPFGRGSPLAQT